MKYIITESKLDSVIFKYLDMKLAGVEKKKGEYVDIVFAYPEKRRGIIGWKKPDNLFVKNTLTHDLMVFFGLDRYDTLDIIERYFAEKYNLNIDEIILVDYIY